MKAKVQLYSTKLFKGRDELLLCIKKSNSEKYITLYASIYRLCPFF